jgi:hypothetical protein
VYGLLQARCQDWQQLRTWVRQLQQAQQQQQQQQEQQLVQRQQQLGSGDESSSWGDAAGGSQVAAAAAAAGEVQQVAVQDSEVQQLILELAGKQQQPGKQSKPAKGKSPAAVARRSIRNMLKPLAVALHAAE